ncbi:SlyX family protein [Coralliovum pocilloporae]|uniref:SlyX family protein n=1 Tax=Coralliovum pocilloporae TaxID=3066369 RepID=UPI0033073F7B
MSTEQLEARIDSLEITIADQQKTIDDLNEMVTRQWDTLKQFEREILKLSGQIELLEEASPAPENQKPPHY